MSESGDIFWEVYLQYLRIGQGPGWSCFIRPTTVKLLYVYALYC